MINEISLKLFVFKVVNQSVEPVETLVFIEIKKPQESAEQPDSGVVPIGVHTFVELQ